MQRSMKLLSVLLVGSLAALLVLQLAAGVAAEEAAVAADGSTSSPGDATEPVGSAAEPIAATVEDEGVGEDSSDDAAFKELIETLSKELDASQEAIALQQRHAEKLAAMREAVLRAGKLPTKLEMSFKSHSARRRATPAPLQASETAPSAPVADGSNAEFTGIQGGRKFREYLMERAAIQVEDIQAVHFFNVRPKRPRKAAQGSPVRILQLLAVASGDGNLYVFTATGEELMHMPVGHTGRVLAIADDFAEHPTLVTSGEDGSVRVFSLSLYYDGILIAGKAPLSSQHSIHKLPTREEDNTLEAAIDEAASMDAAAGSEHMDPEYKPHAFGLTLQLAHFATIYGHDGTIAVLEDMGDYDAAEAMRAAVDEGERHVVTTLDTYHFRTTHTIVCGNDHGVLAIHMLNGTLVRAFHHSNPPKTPGRPTNVAVPVPASVQVGVDKDPTPRKLDFSQPITAMVRFTSTLGYAVGDKIKFASIARRAPLDIVCDTSPERVVSLAFDTLDRNHVWATTDNGDLLVYNMRVKREHTQVCKLVHRFAAASEDAVASVAAVRGYTIAVASDALVSVRNCTGMNERPPSTLLEHQVSGFGDKTAGPLIETSIIGGRTSSTSDTLVAVTFEGANTVVIYESLLPYTPSVFDLGWIRTPMLIGVVVLVVGYQFYKRKNPAAANPAEIAEALRVGGGGGRFRPGMGSRMGSG